MPSEKFDHSQCLSELGEAHKASLVSDADVYQFWVFTYKHETGRAIEHDSIVFSDMDPLLF